MKPSDGLCNYVNSGSGNIGKDSNDPDCAAAPPTLPTSCSSSNGSDPVIQVLPGGRVKITQYYGGCGTSKSKTCTTTSTNAPGYYQPATIGPVSCTN
jgi:hypothetical protein